MKKIKIISKIAEIYRHRHHFCNIQYIMKQEKHIIDSITPTFFELKNCVTLHIIYIMYCIHEAKITDRESPISTISARWGKSADAGYFPAKAKQMGDGIFLP